MEQGLVISLSGALAQSRRIEKLANNIANADTTAYKAQDLVFEEMVQEAYVNDERAEINPESLNESDALRSHEKGRRPVLHGSDFTDLRAGSMRKTGNPLDIAIQGNGFMEVLTPKGVLLTRAGNLSMDAEGRLVNSDGYLILGQAQQNQGAEGADPATRAIRLGNGQAQIDQEGNVYSLFAGGGSQNVGRLSLVQVENPADIKPVGGSLYEAGPNAFLKRVGQEEGGAGREPASVVPQEILSKPNPLGPTNQDPIIHQGMLEASNVNPVGEMSRLIEAHRLYDQNIKVMQNVGEMTGRLSEVGKF